MDLETLKQSLPDLHSAAFSEKSLEDFQTDRVLKKYAGRFNIYEKDFSKHLFRPHALSSLMGGIPKGLTENQAATFEAYSLRRSGIGKPLTENQEADWHDLRRKKFAKPTLSTGAKTYLKGLVKEIIFERRKEIQSKYLDKGILTEDESIRRISELHGVDYQKNTERYENDYFSGEMDIVEPAEVLDVKGSWDYETFPMIDEDLKVEYYWQMQGYFDLLSEKNITKGRVCHVLNDTPQQLIDQQKYYISRDLGLFTDELSFDLPEDLEFEIERNMKYDDIPPEARVKEFDVVKNDDDIAMAKKMIDLSRLYMVELYNGLEKRFTSHL